MAKRIDLTGRFFGKLQVISFSKSVKGVAIWNCACSCGNTTEVRYGNLKSGHTISCGCALKTSITKHGHHKSPTYTSWDCMIQRCTNKNSKAFPRYGMVGITVCEEWLCFDSFLKDMGERPNGTTLDRINGKLGYYKDNCRWATSKEQSRNKKSNVLVTINGSKKILTDWSNELGIPVSTLKRKIMPRSSVSSDPNGSS